MRRIDTIGLYQTTPITPRTPVPLVALDWDIKLMEGIVEMTLAQTYVNSSSTNMECEYSIPIWKRMAVVGFNVQLKLHDTITTIEGVLRDNTKEQVYTKYNNGVAQGSTVTMMQRDPNDEESLRFSMGNLCPQQQATITIKLVGTLEIEAETGSWIFKVPAATTPQFTMSEITAEAAEEHKKFAQECKALPYVWKANVAISASSEVAQVVSDNHKIIMQPIREGGRIVHATLDKETPQFLERDFVLRFSTKNKFTPTLTLQKDPRYDHSAALATLIPSFAPKDTYSINAEFVFLLDCSGSMRGSKLEKAIEATILFVKSLPFPSYFNVYLFAATHTYNLFNYFFGLLAFV